MSVLKDFEILHDSNKCCMSMIRKRKASSGKGKRVQCCVFSCVCEWVCVNMTDTLSCPPSFSH